MVTRVEPAMIGGAEAVESTKFDHRMSPVGVVSAVQIGLEGVQENCNKFAHDVQVIRTMKLGEPTLDQLRLFLTVEEEGSFGGAARRLGRAISRSEERRVGKECVSTCRSRWSP